jgi:GNAT superfamily N-acetyltransferase
VNSLRQPEFSACTISVREFEPGDERAFARLNQAWIEKYFRLEEKDRATLENPRKYILENGGQIFVAMAGAHVAGCVALVRIDNRTYEVAKMAVDEAFQQRGVGRTLMNAAIAWARSRMHVGSGWSQSHSDASN